MPPSFFLLCRPRASQCGDRPTGTASHASSSSTRWTSPEQGAHLIHIRFESWNPFYTKLSGMLSLSSPSSLSRTLKSMESRLKTTPLVTQLPLGVGQDFRGIIDLVSMEALMWERGTDGASFSRVPLGDGSPVGRATLEEAQQARYHLVEQVRMFTCAGSEHIYHCHCVYRVDLSAHCSLATSPSLPGQLTGRAERG